MKAVVVEKKKNQVVVLKDDGTFAHVAGDKYQVGDVMDMKSTSKGFGWKGALVSAAAMLLLVFGVGAKVYTTPAYYVSLDVNPGIVFEVNRFERVIGFEGQNDDGDMVLQQLKLKNKSADEAIRMTVEKINEEGYFGENEMIYLATLSKDEEKAARLSGKLENAVEEEVEENGVKAEVSAGLLGYDMVQKARELGITPGKLNIIVNVLGQEPSQENMDSSIKELMSKYKDRGNSADAPGQNKPEKTTGKPETTPGNGPPAKTPPVIEQEQQQNQDQNREQIMDPQGDMEQEQNQEQEQNGLLDEQQNQENNANGESNDAPLAPESTPAPDEL
ncbi:hypothetical protein J0B03_03530 [Alkalibacter rhizosphaerae]|uniref:RsgI N-terminal anti-sigma domain-containing protein n=1 Tax=Alkalibacter rhizosphaerae TaxID=2815577 RepID=A0A974XIT5_9FIRM|nr:hypothetical protein [Alkalibacter rhizosphaerae]QSX09153.1 hypothetical protein J0B03_03530 [Alkalibacter rhizosphaerae]